MAGRGQLLKFGIFLALCTGVLLLLLVGFAGFTPWKKTDTYYVLVPDSVNGLEPGSPVELRGVRVGRVVAFDPAPHDFAGVRVSLEIEPGAHVTSTARAFLKFKGLTGLRLIDIEQTSSSGPRVAPGNTIPYEETTIERLSERSGDLLDKAVNVMQGADSLIQQIDAIAGRLEPERLNRAASDASAALLQFRIAGAELTRTLSETRHSLRNTLREAEGTLKHVDDVAVRAARAVDQVSLTARETTSLVRASDEQVRSTIYNLQAASQSLKELGRSLEEDPSRLLFSSPPRERALP